jgi:hypothetical protein
LYPVLQKAIEDLDQQVSEQALRYPQAQRLMTHPGVGPVTALATQVFLGDPQRFADGRAVASYIGLIPSERSSGRRQRLGKLSKEGNALVRYLWGEATIHAVRRDPELKRFYRRKLMQKGLGKAKTAAARKLGIRFPPSVFPGVTPNRIPIGICCPLEQAPPARERAKRRGQFHKPAIGELFKLACLLWEAILRADAVRLHHFHFDGWLARTYHARTGL